MLSGNRTGQAIDEISEKNNTINREQIVFK